MAAAAITATKVAGASGVRGNKRVRVYDLTWTGDYVAGGTSLTASQLGLRKIHEIHFHGGVAVAADLALALPVYYNHATSKVVLYESAGDGDPMDESSASTVPTGLTVRVTAVGY